MFSDSSGNSFLDDLVEGAKKFGKDAVKFSHGLLVGIGDCTIDTVTFPFKFAYEAVTDPVGTFDSSISYITSGNWLPHKVIGNIYNNVSGAIKSGNWYNIGYSLGNDIAGPILLSSVVVDTSVKSGKFPKINNGNGYKIKNVEFLYRNPSFELKYNRPGLTFINISGYKKSGNYGSIFRFEWDPKDGYHHHYKP